ncbi:MAG TPA: hypothetical protein VLZ44_04825 [Treponemataceae bacterium]|nr:hypothetical protein [Treponemataceae bacterium]
MKNKNTIRAILSFSFLLFAACKIEPIFYAIEKEVPLEKAVIKGNLYAMTEFNDKLYAASGSLYEKNINEERGWKAVSAPGFIIRVASDESNLYVLTEDKKLYTKTKTTGWSQITGISPIELFDNKASTNKTAYVTTSEGLYSLNDKNTSKISGGDKSSKAAVYDGLSTVFSKTVLIAKGDKGVYKIDENKLAFNDDTSNVEVSGAQSMAVYNDGSKESLLIGTTSGIVLINLDTGNGEPTAKGTMFGGNVESSIAMLEIKTLYSFGDAIYAFAVDKTTSKKTNTWGYYKDRPNWNVE